MVTSGHRNVYYTKALAADRYLRQWFAETFGAMKFPWLEISIERVLMYTCKILTIHTVWCVHAVLTAYSRMCVPMYVCMVLTAYSRMCVPMYVWYLQHAAGCVYLRMYGTYSMQQDVCAYVCMVLTACSRMCVPTYGTHSMQQDVCAYVWYSQHGMTVVFATSATLLPC